jgi:hypothetical protein
MTNPSYSDARVPTCAGSTVLLAAGTPVVVPPWPV